MLSKILKIQIIFAFLFTFSINNAFGVYDNVRSDVYFDYEKGNCNTGSFKFNPLQNNIDVNWQLANPTCAGFIAGLGVAIVASGQIVKKMCIATNMIGVSKAAAEEAGDPIPDHPFITPDTGIKMAYRSSILCANRGGEYGALQSSAAAACAAMPGGPLCVSGNAESAKAATDMSKCCKSYLAYAASVGAGMTALASIYGVAKKSFEEANICGHNWNIWRKFDVNGDEIKPEQDGFWRIGPYKNSYQKCLEDIFAGQYDKTLNPCKFEDNGGVKYWDLNLSNKYYREYLYGGVEFEDVGEGACKTPKSWDSKRRKAILGYDGDNQRYYMKGPGVAGNYACYRFLLSDNRKFDEEASKSYDCCVERSQSTLCIKSPSSFSQREHGFCKFGSFCKVGDVTFELYYSQAKSDLLCAKTYSVCPYNHNLGGGTSMAKYEVDASGNPTSRIENFCQVNKHCAKVPVKPYIRMSTLNSAFISSACKDLKGDSQNLYSFDVDLFPLHNVRSFSAPIAQCFKETLANIILNKAGHTKCKDPDESPDRTGQCKSGYHFVKNAYLNQKSPFAKMQDNLYWIIKMVLTLSVTFFGATILLGMEGVKKKQLYGYIIKIGLIMYFALGNGWQFGFLDGVLETSTTVGDIFMKIDEDKPQEKLDGCQFPRFDSRLLPDDTNRFNVKRYPDGLEYLRIWDTLDCKLIRALGFAPDVSVPNLLVMMAGGLFTGGLGVVFVTASAIFAFMFLSLIFRALHIFLISIIAMVILIYVSPIVFTLSLFQKTKSIFDGWVKQMLGFAFQPVILFAYLGVFIALFENTMIGDVRFEGDGLKVPKKIVCEGEVNDKSMYCIFKIAKFKTFTGLEAIGIGVPLLLDMNSQKLSSIIEAAIIMFIFSSFMDQVSTLANKMIGGSEMTSNSPNTIEIAKEFMENTKGVSKRGTRAMKKILGKTNDNIDKFKKATRESGDMGKSISKPGDVDRKNSSSSSTNKP